NIVLQQYQGKTLVNEYGKSGELLSSIGTPGTGWTDDPAGKINWKSGFGLAAPSLYKEYGRTIPWENVRNAFGRLFSWSPFPDQSLIQQHSSAFGPSSSPPTAQSSPSPPGK